MAPGPKISPPKGLAGFVADTIAKQGGDVNPGTLVPAEATAAHADYNRIIGWTVPLNVNRAQLACKLMRLLRT